MYMKTVVQHILLPLDHKKRKKSLFKKKQSTKRAHVHKIRLQFKELDAYLALVNMVTKQHIKLPDGLAQYYKLLGTYREVTIFDELCKRYTPHAKAILSINKKQLLKAKKKLYEFYQNVSPKQLSEQAQHIIQLLTQSTRDFQEVDILKDIESFVLEQENLTKHLLKNPIITDVSLHEIRKRIKTGMYLLPQAASLEPVIFKRKLKAYTKLAKKIGERNDVNQLLSYLDKLPRTGKEAELLKKIRHQEQKKKSRILKKLRTYFMIQPVALSESTKRVSSSTKSLKVIP